MTDESNDRARELDEALVMHEPDPLLKSDPLAPRPDAPTVALKLARLCGECEAIFEGPREECPKCASRSYVPVASMIERRALTDLDDRPWVAFRRVKDGS